MAEWHFAQIDPSEELAELHYFSMKKHQPEGDVEFIITVKEYVDRNPHLMRFFAQADKEVGQKTGAFRPFGWGATLSQALSECMKLVRRHSFEPDADEGDSVKGQ
jgi:hypothetical protein